MSSKVKVLIVEDLASYHDKWRNELGSKVTIISALSIKEAERQFTANPDIVAIVMDACVPGDTPTTQPLVTKFRKTFAGPMIAISSLESYQQQLLKAGCDYKSTKNALSQKLLKVLSL